MKIGRLIEILKAYDKEYKLYDSENPEFYLSSLEYQEEEDRFYMYFQEEEEK
ncbi:hypothetical protein [Clostridium formicaceticum]|uniref:Uncharacterized protein n=1 Tax=Clostridium formicaceticum TaxID=1497 RepID=A0AAC9RKT8_9CLOT|nr:hypothetical protein [Clostridium formicaceticum]ARE89091.1 hypothetical protein CLFO_34970 [Clostridium formicaceticum]